MAVIPKRIVNTVRGTYDVAELGQPAVQGEVLGVGVPRPQSLERHLREIIHIHDEKGLGLTTRTSYFASGQAQQVLRMGGWRSSFSFISSQSTLVREPSSLYQVSLDFTSVALMPTQPLPDGGAIHITFEQRKLQKQFS